MYIFSWKKHGDHASNDRIICEFYKIARRSGCVKCSPVFEKGDELFIKCPQEWSSVETDTAEIRKMYPDDDVTVYADGKFPEINEAMLYEP